MVCVEHDSRFIFLFSSLSSDSRTLIEVGFFWYNDVTYLVVVGRKLYYPTSIPWDSGWVGTVGSF